MIGKEVMNLFNQYFVYEYIQSFYAVLPTMWTRYIGNDINFYIQSRQKA